MQLSYHYGVFNVSSCRCGQEFNWLAASTPSLQINHFQREGGLGVRLIDNIKSFREECKFIDFPPPHTHTRKEILIRLLCVQGLYKKEWTLLTLQITQSRHLISVADVKNVYIPHVVDLKFTIQKYEEIYKNCTNRRYTASLCQE